MTPSSVTLEDRRWMGRTYRVGVGVRRLPGETWADTATRVLVEDSGGPIVARFVYQMMVPGLRYLDLGCGREALQVQALRRLGYDVTGWDSDLAERIAPAIESGFIDPGALDRRYDCVMLSNVINVQPRFECLAHLLLTVQRCLRPAGVLVANLAERPRPLISPGTKGREEIDEVLRAWFREVVLFPGPLWLCARPTSA